MTHALLHDFPATKAHFRDAPELVTIGGVSRQTLPPGGQRTFITPPQSTPPQNDRRNWAACQILFYFHKPCRNDYISIVYISIPVVDAIENVSNQIKWPVQRSEKAQMMVYRIHIKSPSSEMTKSLEKKNNISCLNAIYKTRESKMVWNK